MPHGTTFSVEKNFKGQNFPSHIYGTFSRQNFFRYGMSTNVR